MERMNWKDGWHNYYEIEYYIENGVFVRGKIGEIPVKPYVKSKAGGYDRVYNMKANKRNFFQDILVLKEEITMHRARDRPIQ